MVTMKSTAMLWDVRLLRPVEVHRRCGGTHWFSLDSRRADRASKQKQSKPYSACTASYSNRKMEAICSSEALVNFYHSTRLIACEDT
jgi:hypothetical protein